ncbi:MAG TPA: glycosyltransferase family 4 protein [Candidatus Acidoferrum sp.]|nr:glycosyltransferase family 4 protein [Candidatus Acidoferrum sp.]
MSERRFKVLAVAAHPVQYMAPLFRRMAAEPQLNLQVAYCSLRGAEAAIDPDFATSVKWDVPLLEGYSWRAIPNKGSGKESFWGLNNPELSNLIRDGKFDAVLCFVGYVRASFWIARRAAKASGAAFLFGTDAHSLAPRDGKAWKVLFKKAFWPFLFRRADQVIVPSTGTFEMVKSLGIPAGKITLTPYSVDNDWWKAQAAMVNRDTARENLGATSHQPIILFCAKLQPWKRPMDLLQAFAQAAPEESILVFAGEGPQRANLEAGAAQLGIQQRVRFLGFVNQSQLPALYTAANLLVLPSVYEPFGVVVNEAMCCGCPVMVSDQVGAARDLVAPVSPQFVFPAGNVQALANVLRIAFADREQLREVGRRGFAHVETHSPQRIIAATVEAVRKAVEVVRNEK